MRGIFSKAGIQSKIMKAVEGGVIAFAVGATFPMIQQYIPGNIPIDAKVAGMVGAYMGTGGDIWGLLGGLFATGAVGTGAAVPAAGGVDPYLVG